MQHGVHRKIDQTVSHKTKLQNESQKIQENPRKTQKKWSDKLQHQQITEKVFSNVPASTCLNLKSTSTLINLNQDLHFKLCSPVSASRYAVQSTSQPQLNQVRYNLKGYYLQNDHKKQEQKWKDTYKKLKITKRHKIYKKWTKQTTKFNNTMYAQFQFQICWFHE